MSNVVDFEVLCPLPSRANANLHWTARSRLVMQQRNIVRAQLLAKGATPPPLPVVVVMTRIGAALDDDNLAGALKGVQDAVAHWLGVDDRDPRVSWVRRQEKRSGQPRGLQALRVEVRELCRCELCGQVVA